MAIRNHHGMYRAVLLLAGAGMALGQPVTMSISPTSGSGAYQAFTLTFSDTNGYADLRNPEVIFNTSANGFNGGNACYIVYDRVNSRVQLVNDSGSGSTPVRLGTADVAGNSQCTLYGYGSSAVASGNSESITVNLGFKPAFYGLKNIYLYTGYATSSTAGPILAGTWDPEVSVTTGPSIISATPVSSSGSSGTFNLAYFDPNGFADLSSTEVIFGSVLDGRLACVVIYDPISNSGLLVNDSSTGSTQVRFGTADIAQNGQCMLSGSGSSAVTAGGMLIVNLALTFNQSFGSTIAKNIYLDAYNQGGQTSGFQTAGTWTVPAFTNQAPAAISASPSSGTGAYQTFTFNFSDPNGYGDLSYPEVIINTNFNGIGACLVIYDRGNNQALLVNDAGTGSTPVPLGSNTVAQNSQCIVYGIGSFGTEAGNNQSVTLNLGFKPSFYGPNNIHLYTADAGGLNTGGYLAGQWDPEASAQVSPSTISATPASGSGSSGYFSFAYFDPNGAADLSSPEVIFAPFIDGREACYVIYDQISNSGMLVNDRGTGSTQVRFGTADVAENGQCTLSGLTSSGATVGGLLVFNLALTFKQSFGSSTPKNIYLYTSNQAHQASGFQTAGTWSVPTFVNVAPSTMSASPSSGSGPSQTFTLTFSDPNGFGDLVYPEVLFNTSFIVSGSCLVMYDRLNYQALLMNDAGSSSTAVRLETTDVAQNSQCTLYGGGSSASGTGVTQTLILNLSFNASFAGAKNMYLYTADVGGLTALQNMGQWTVPTPIPPDFSISVSNSFVSLNPLVISAGNGSFVFIAVTPVGAFSSPVNLSLSSSPALPAGSQFYIVNQSSFPTGSGSATLKVIVPAPSAGYIITVTGTTSGNVSHSVSFQLSVGGPFFSLSPSPSSQSVTAGASASFTVSLMSGNGFSGTVGPLTTSLLPTGVTAAFSPPTLTGQGTTTLNVSTSASSTPAGSYQLQIIGSGLSGSIEVAGYGFPTLIVNGTAPAQQTIMNSPPGRSLIVDGVNCISPCQFQWTVGSSHTINTVATQIDANGTLYQFSSWSDGLAISHSITASSGATTYTASFITQFAPAQQTITTAPPGLSLAVDGVNCVAPCGFRWTVGTNHTIATIATQAGPSATLYQYLGWSDGLAISHVIAASSGTTVYVANFTTQYYLTTAALPTGGGTISPASGWYNSGLVVQVSATANSGYPFLGFSGDLGGTASPQNLTMSGPKTVAAVLSNVTLSRSDTRLACSICYFDDEAIMRLGPPGTIIYAVVIPYIAAGPQSGVTMYYRAALYLNGHQGAG